MKNLLGGECFKSLSRLSLSSRLAIPCRASPLAGSIIRLPTTHILCQQQIQPPIHNSIHTAVTHTTHSLALRSQGPLLFPSMFNQHTLGHAFYLSRAHSTSPPTCTTTTASGSMESSSGSSTENSRPLGSRRQGSAPPAAAQLHPPGSGRWNQWARQLQFLGLTKEQADATLTPVQPMMKQAPANIDADFKILAAAILRDTGLTAAQLQQIALRCPDLLRMTSTTSVVGNVNWFRVTLGISIEEWVRLVCGCRPLLSAHQVSLQQRLDDLLVVGMDKAAVKECWMHTPDLLRLRPGQLVDKVGLLQTLFPGINILDTLKSDPSAVLQPSRKLRDRTLFLQKLGNDAVIFEEIQHSVSDRDFAFHVVGVHLQVSGKSLPQLCRELQAEPGVREYMEKSQVDPATMNEYKYFLVASMFARPQHVAAAGGSDSAPESE